MPETPPTEQAITLRWAAVYIDLYGLYTGDEAFAASTGNALDVPAAIYQAANDGVLPSEFALPSIEAIERCKSRIITNPVAMDTIRTLSAHLNSDAVGAAAAAIEADPIDALAAWPDQPGVTQEVVTTALRALAQTLTDTGSPSAAA
ncbi:MULTISPECIES: DUF6197 family protein [Streptomycetaceae]|uniref:Uncharacterized protein n=1 Tax=Streptantibioticus cattleyicolor (strain ATCC 35852 / DSM 46488 / JCM 4925 / NBRC 14057 / NRRL 8057) TaxID=1003195 RepID=F8JWW0_STREN|nr:MULTISPECIES: hypothetical protein [Streptomycetaceae]AEW93004.1 hypothetical protein SCATT_06330 [Streptantibioticus cattleyicolor NRRL 8057 = DSM 46488]MYS57741.1 hypothetical protein [Streptomyces sp. SID5468]CCB73363.1 protein of unknown function [Streptantibioticus cattleyicolor NRRL 8057 = DSM 46488]